MPDYKPLFNTSGKRLFATTGEPLFAYVRAGHIDVAINVSGHSDAYVYGYGVPASDVSHTFNCVLTRSGTTFSTFSSQSGQSYDLFLCTDTAGREWRTYISLGTVSLSYSATTHRWTLGISGGCRYQDQASSSQFKVGQSCYPSYLSDTDLVPDTTYTGSNVTATYGSPEYTRCTAPSSLTLSFTEA